MIETKIRQRCPHCQSEAVIKNGHNAQGKQQYHCKACGKRGVLQASVAYSEAAKAQIIDAYYERPSMRGIERIFGVTRQTLATWLKKKRNTTNGGGDAGSHAGR